MGCLLTFKQLKTNNSERKTANVAKCEHLRDARGVRPRFHPLLHERQSEGRQASELKKELGTRIQAKYTLLLDTSSQGRSVLVSMDGRAPRIPVRSPSHVCAPLKVSGTAEVRQTVPGPESLLGSKSQSNTEAVSHRTFWGFLQE